MVDGARDVGAQLADLVLELPAELQFLGVEQLGDLPSVIENDTNAAALAEATLGAGRGRRIVVYSNSGSGIGGGLVIDGRLYHGAGVTEMEIGHLRLSPQGGITGIQDPSRACTSSPASCGSTSRMVRVP